MSEIKSEESELELRNHSKKYKQSSFVDVEDEMMKQMGSNHSSDVDVYSKSDSNNGERRSRGRSLGKTLKRYFKSQVSANEKQSLTGIGLEEEDMKLFQSFKCIDFDITKLQEEHK
jgi:hypothetical protein